MLPAALLPRSRAMMDTRFGFLCHDDMLSTENESRNKLTPAQRELQEYIKQLRVEACKAFDTNEGIYCSGEPSVDPSRIVRPNQGDSEWMDDW